MLVLVPMIAEMFWQEHGLRKKFNTFMLLTQ